MLTDADLTVVHVKRGLAGRAGRSGRLAPVSPDRVVGSPIDVLHSNPARQRAVFADAARRLPLETRIEIGPETIALRVAALHDDDGRFVGALATWDPLTQTLHLEAEVARVSAMVEHAPTNMMFVDPDGVIASMNPASLHALQSLRHLLPVSPEDAVGSSLDLIAPGARDGAATGAAVLVPLGSEVLEFRAAPVKGGGGAPAGAVLTWDVATERVRSEADRIEGEADIAASTRVEVGLAEATTEEQAIMIALNRVREEFGWAYGSYWRRDLATQTLRFVAESGSVSPEFRAVTLDASFAEGIGLSGRAWATRDLFFTPTSARWSTACEPPSPSASA